MCSDSEIDVSVFRDRWIVWPPWEGLFIAKEKNGLYTSDECFKMSLTDAISVACKSLGFAADIYWNNDRSKYDRPEETQMAEPPKKIDDTKAQVIYDLLQKTNADVKAFLKYYGVKARLRI